MVLVVLVVAAGAGAAAAAAGPGPAPTSVSLLLYSCCLHFCMQGKQYYILFFCCYADVAAIAMDFVLVNVFMLFCVPILFLLPPPDLSLFCRLYHWRWWITFLMHLYLCAVRIDYPEGVHAKLGFKAQT